jgi:hypothetical protein
LQLGHRDRFRRHARILLDFAQVRLPRRAQWRVDQIGHRAFRSYSFYGEDAVVRGLLERWRFEGIDLPQLSYVDVGAWRPVAGSNTFWLYRAGVRGTLVEPNPYLTGLIRAARPGDQLLPVACSTSQTLQYFSFGPYAESNTTSHAFAGEIARAQDVSLGSVTQVPGWSLERILEAHLQRFNDVFLLNIDAEGVSERILMSTAWTSLPRRPRVIISEADDIGAARNSDTTPSDTVKYMQDVGYRLVAKCGVSEIFVDRS